MSFKLGDFLPAPETSRPTPPSAPAPSATPAAPPRCARTGKVRYAKRKDTEAHLRHLASIDPQADRLFQYRCFSCGDFHIGHKE